jgi:regulator of protease activity HflC (stomatin/prohibitin superfamily)
VSRAPTAGNSALNLNRVQDELNSRLSKAINRTLGREYLTNYQFRLAAITPPEAVQTSIDRVQAARAQVSEAQAQVQRARLEAEANRERAAVYQDCPACAALDQLREAKNLPEGSNIYIGIDPVVATR